MGNWLRSHHTGELLKLGLPIMLGQLGVILVGFIDNMMLGHYGTAELSSASFVNGFMNIAFVMGMGFSYGLTPLVAGSNAASDGQLKGLLKNSLVANTLLGILLTLVMGLFLVNIHWLRQPEELLSYIRPYFLIQLVSIIPMMIFNGYKQFADGVGKTQVGMVAIIISNVVNIILNYGLIFGRMGMPEWGLVGAGIATLTARLVSLGVMMWAIHCSSYFRRIFELNKSEKGRWIERPFFKKLFELGVPSGIQMGLEAGVFSVAVIMVGWIGSLELAAHQIINTASTIGYMLYYGMSAAVTIRVGYFYSLNRPDEIRSVVRAGAAIQFLMALSVVVVVLVSRQHLARLFTTDVALIELVAVIAYPLALYQFSDMLQILFSNALRGMQDVKFTAIAATFCYIVLTLSCAYYFAFVLGWGVVGIWGSFTVGFTTLSISLILRYRYLLKRMEKQV